MPTIAQAVAKNQERIARAANTPAAQPAPESLPTPPQDLPAGGGLPQRGMFPADLTLNSDRSDSNRAYRGQGVRSSTFPFAAPPNFNASALQTKLSLEAQTKATAEATTAAAELASQAAIAAQAAQNAANQAITNAAVNAFAGAWTASLIYSQGSEVSYDGGFYVSLSNANQGNEPDTSPIWWTLVSNISTSEFLGAWNSATAYVIGNQVTYNQNYYIAIADNTNAEPDVSPTKWQQISSSEFYTGTYSGLTAYVPGNQVSYQGNFYICISATTGNAPSSSSSFWTLLGTSAILIGAWSSTTSYLAGMQVTYAPSGGSTNYYIALQASTNQAPAAATNSYWYLIANNTAISSASSYRPTSNPLTATDAGSSVTITIASFTMNIAGVGAVSVNGGTITGLSYATVYYIYYADPTISGGTVSFQDATTKTSSISSGVDFYVGSILTPPSGGGTTLGNNDGGTGAQTGGTITIFPTTWTVTAGNGWSSNTAGIDGDPSTWTSPPGDGSAEPGTVVLGGLPPIIFPGTANVVLVLDWECSGGGSSTTSVSVANPTASHSMPTGNFGRTVTMVSLGANFNPAFTEITINMTSSFSGFSNLYDVYLLIEF